MSPVEAAIDRYGPERAGALAAFELYAAGTTFATTSALDGPR